MFFGAFAFLIASIDFFGGSGDTVFLILALLCFFGAPFLLGFYLSKKIGVAILGVLLAIFVGIPIVYLWLIPFSNVIFDSIYSTGNLSLSGSFGYMWFLLITVVLVTAVTVKAKSVNKWLGMAVGIIIALFVTLGIEILTSSLSQTSQLDTIRSAIYSPIVWGLVVFFATFRNFSN